MNRHGMGFLELLKAAPIFGCRHCALNSTCKMFSIFFEFPICDLGSERDFANPVLVPAHEVRGEACRCYCRSRRGCTKPSVVEEITNGIDYTELSCAAYRRAHFHTREVCIWHVVHRSSVCGADLSELEWLFMLKIYLPRVNSHAICSDRNSSKAPEQDVNAIAAFAGSHLLMRRLCERPSFGDGNEQGGVRERLISCRLLPAPTRACTPTLSRMCRGMCGVESRGGGQGGTFGGPALGWISSIWGQRPAPREDLM
jgi:hypothetical protein